MVVIFTAFLSTVGCLAPGDECQLWLWSAGHRTLRRGRDRGGVFGEHARRIARRGRNPRGEPAAELGGAQVHLQLPALDVDGHLVSVLERGDRTAHRRL